MYCAVYCVRCEVVCSYYHLHVCSHRCLRASRPPVPTVESTVCSCEVSVHCAVYGVHCEVVVRVIQYYHLSLQPVSSLGPSTLCV